MNLKEYKMKRNSIYQVWSATSDLSDAYPSNGHIRLALTHIQSALEVNDQLGVDLGFIDPATCEFKTTMNGASK